MTRKKAKDTDDAGRTVEVDTEDLCLTEVELKTLDLHIAREQMNRAIRDKLTLEEEMLKIRYEADRATLRKKQAEAEASRVAAATDYNAARGGIERHLGINLNEYVVSESGQLRKVTESGPS